MNYPEGEKRNSRPTNTGQGEWRLEKERPVYIDQFGRRTRAWNNRRSFTAEELAQGEERLVYIDQFGRRTRFVKDVPQEHPKVVQDDARPEGIVKRTIYKLLGLGNPSNNPPQK